MLKWWRICKDQGEAKMESQVSQVQVLLIIISTTIMQQYLLIQRLLWFSIVWIDCLHLSMLVKVITWYSRSCSCHHSRKHPALVTTTFVKSRLNCDLNVLMKSYRKRPRPLAGLPNGTFLLFLSSRKWPLSDHSVFRTWINTLMKLHTEVMV